MTRPKSTPSLALVNLIAVYRPDLASPSRQHRTGLPSNQRPSQRVRRSSMSTVLPESHADLLERPLFAHLATIRPDGSPQSSVMWFSWDGQLARFSHTSNRQKYRNLLADGRVSFHVQDPDNAYRTLEVRGQVVSMDPDPDAAFYRSLQRRYGSEGIPVLDAEVRVVIVVEPTNFVSVSGGLTEPETEAVTALLERLGEDA
jgi:PPOX class probable F420-dependent enzyme